MSRRKSYGARPFAAGSLRGIRAFQMWDGGLIGPAYPQKWVPGENIARCPTGSMNFHMSLMTYQWNVTTWKIGRPWGNPEPVPPEVPHRPVVGHDVGSMACTCGFYGYHIGGMTRTPMSTIGGIIEGYGVCTVGALGFRCSKARIMALFGEVTSDLGEMYGVPVYRNLVDAITDHPVSSVTPDDRSSESSDPDAHSLPGSSP